MWYPVTPLLQCNTGSSLTPPLIRSTQRCKDQRALTLSTSDGILLLNLGCLTAVSFVGGVDAVVLSVTDETAVHTATVAASELTGQAHRGIYVVAVGHEG